MNNTVGIRHTANVLWNLDEEFEFRILSSPDDLETAIRQKAAEGRTARMSAGFCWPWSDSNPYGTLVEDVQIGSYTRPWNTKPHAGRLAKGIPKASAWAHDPAGIDQVGCVYTAHGFEFDYVGVVFGNDLLYDPVLGDWKGNPKVSHDKKVKSAKAGFTRLVKNTYRILLTRGMKGYYVCFLDKNTEAFFRSRVERTVSG